MSCEAIHCLHMKTHPICELNPCYVTGTSYGMPDMSSSKTIRKSVASCPAVHARERTTRHSKRNNNTISHSGGITPCSVMHVDLHQTAHKNSRILADDNKLTGDSSVTGIHAFASILSDQCQGTSKLLHLSQVNIQLSLFKRNHHRSWETYSGR